VRRLVVSVGVSVALVLAGGPAWAYCYSQLIYGPNGQMTHCYTCCPDSGGGFCTTTCL
jgi:hypothetical protein